MSMGPRFSIVIPCFNQGAFIEECLQSVEAQTLAAHEVIVVNDGSTDVWTVQQLEQRCRAPVKLIHQENRGLAGARNTGIRHATGDWILPLDCDDQLEPNALESYAEAIAREPGIDVWYPDIVHFGVDNDLWECASFNPWRQLWSNQMVCSSAIRRTVFDAGVFYNERMRHGYEDWEFYIHACCERDFIAKSLGRAVFRYRRWGHSMLSDSNSKAAQIVEQLRSERPIFQDSAGLIRLKTRSAPYFAVAAQGPALVRALERQTLRDYRVVDASDRVLREGDLSAFQGQLGAGLLVSLSDEGLSQALLADPFLLEKAARIHSLHSPGLMWLVTERSAAAYPGFLVEKPTGIALAVVISTRHLFERPHLPRSGDGFISDLERHLEGNVPGSSLFVIAGPETLPGGVVAPQPRARPLPPPSLAPENGAPDNSERLALIGLGMSKFVRGVIGPAWHDRLLSNGVLRGLKSGVRYGDFGQLRGWVSAWRPSLPRWHRRVAASFSATPEQRSGPFAPGVLERERERQQAWFIATEKPLFPQAPQASEALLVVVPWIIHGGVDRAIVDLLRGVRRGLPQVPCYLATSIPAINAWSDETLPHLDGVFSLHAFGSNDYSRALVDLGKRLGVKTVMIANSRAGFDALPLIRRELPHVRVVVQAHNFEPDPVTRMPGGHVAYVASRYNNLVHAYTTISRKTAEVLQRNFYVSPGKIRVVYLGIDSRRFVPARRERFRPGERIEVLWLGRLSGEKDPILALRVAEEWKARHGVKDVHFRIVGGGPMADEVRKCWERMRLQDLVDLVPPTDDPVPLYRDADCLMLTSKYEGTPVVVFEALAAGVVPLTAVSNSSMDEYLSPRSAYVVDSPRDPLSFVAALEQMVGDREEAKARAARALADSPRFDTERYVQETMEVLFTELPLAPPVRAAS